MEAQMIGSARARLGRPPIERSLVGDERLARAVAGSASERAFAALYERYRQPLYRYCRSILGNDADAQDALQSAFAAAFAALRRGQRRAPVRPWLFRIVHNESVSALRRRCPEDELLEQHEGLGVSVEDRAEERARLALLVADLHELPERQRAALVMRELSGLSHEEIAIALGKTVGAAKQTICEARRSLLEFSEGRAMECEQIQRTISDADGRALRGRRVRAHLRDCAGCAAFAAAIPARRADLRALAPPLPAVAAAGLFARALGGGSGTGAGGAGGVAGGAAGQAVVPVLAAKAVTGAAIVATATAGVVTALRHPVHARQLPVTPIAAAIRQVRGPAPGTNLESRSRVGRTAARPAGQNGAFGVRAAPVPHATRARSAGQASPAAGGARSAGQAPPAAGGARSAGQAPPAAGGAQTAGQAPPAAGGAQTAGQAPPAAGGLGAVRSGVPRGGPGGRPPPSPHSQRTSTRGSGHTAPGSAASPGAHRRSGSSDVRLGRPDAAPANRRSIEHPEGGAVPVDQRPAAGGNLRQAGYV